jgi:hypothetical protein
MIKRKCKTCLEEKPLSEFYLNGESVFKDCKACISDRASARYDNKRQNPFFMKMENARKAALYNKKQYFNYKNQYLKYKKQYLEFESGSSL